MKKIHYLIATLLCATMTACMDFDWDEHQPNGTETGNPYVQDTNVVSIADLKKGHTVSVSASGNSSKVVNQMARDYWFDNEKTKATAIETSSFCAVHQISEPLYGDASGRFDTLWGSRAALSASMKKYKELKANNEL